MHYIHITCFICKSVWIPCHLVDLPILFYTWPYMCFIWIHFHNVRRKCHTIRNFTFDLHTMTTKSERHVSVCLHALIAQMFCRIYCRILCRILFPHIARSHTFSQCRRRESRCTTSPKISVHLRRSLYNNPRRANTHSKKISVQHPQAISRLSWMHPPGAESFGSEVSCQMYTDGSSCVLWA